MLSSLAPRQHTVLGRRSPILIFTDGACESGVATAGAIIIDGSEKLACDILVPDAQVAHWLEHAGDQIIYQIELWALLALKWHFRHKFMERRIISWIDNESARIYAIKANNPSKTMRALIRVLASVYSFSNPGDLPSRGKLKEAAERFAIQNISTLDVSQDLENFVLHLHDNPFDTALLNWGHKTEPTKRTLVIVNSRFQKLQLMLRSPLGSVPRPLEQADEKNGMLFSSTLKAVV